MHPGESWHGFKDIPDNWSMLDPIKVSILAPGMGEDGELEETGVPAALVTAWLGRHGIVPTRTTDFQIMFLFSMGVTRGKWGTLVNTLCSFKRHYDANTPLAQVMPELVEQYPDTYVAVNGRGKPCWSLPTLAVRSNPGSQGKCAATGSL